MNQQISDNQNPNEIHYFLWCSHGGTVSAENNLYDVETGKTTFFNQIDEMMNKNISESIGLDVLTYTINNKKIILWDTTGDKKYRMLIQSHLRSNCGILLFIDLAREETINNIEMWLDMVEKHNHCPHKHPIFLIGTKNQDNLCYDHTKLEDLVVKHKLIHIATLLKDLDAISIMNIIVNEVEERFKNIKCIGIQHDNHKSIKIYKVSCKQR